MYIKPWSKESENYFRRLAKDRIMYTDNIKFTRNFGRKYPSLFNKDTGVMDIGRIDKRKQSMIAIRPGMGIAPMEGPDWRRRKFTHFQVYKMF